jgi:hypothetical protein
MHTTGTTLLTIDALSLTDTSTLRTNSQMHSLGMYDELGETLAVAEWLDVLVFKPNFLKLMSVELHPHHRQKITGCTTVGALHRCL